MTKDQVIQMAKEAGFNSCNRFSPLIVRHSNGSWVDVEAKIARFAALSYAAGQRDMRERAAAVCENTKWSNWFQSDCIDAIRALKIEGETK